MVDRLTVDPADLLRSAEAHEQRAAGWRRIRDTPPHDPDQLAQDLGFVGHAFVETIRHVRNPQRARDADNLASGYAKDAHALRAGAADYLGSDQASAVGITGSFEGRDGERQDRATVQALGAGDSVRLPGVEPTAPTGPAPTPPPPPTPPNSPRPR
ncbi:hypothetical protein KL953_32740 [Mycolicibacterium goodii]|uniref:type VII secretion target n=1 Tax=Mycolicibacterium goodii TaxID=134601 RepID=UPI001BDC5AFC|nr:type VII secretion target [Mycolicibacterium goodii]MBU8813645.1 hypothetical protein [Mycolicibacterium goodii]